MNKSTRNKKIDFSKLGQKKTLSNSSCHKCKTMIPVNEENFCAGVGLLLEPSTLTFLITTIFLKDAKKDKKKASEPCLLRFCSDCLEKHYRDSWVQKKKCK